MSALSILHKQLARLIHAGITSGDDNPSRVARNVAHDILRNFVISGIGDYATEHAAAAAIRTVQRLGYTYTGGVEWRPSIGRRPAFLDREDRGGERP